MLFKMIKSDSLFFFAIFLQIKWFILDKCSNVRQNLKANFLQMPHFT